MKSVFGCAACYFGEAGAHDSGLVDRKGVWLPNFDVRLSAGWCPARRLSRLRC
jgi:hypothetical protein